MLYLSSKGSSIFHHVFEYLHFVLPILIVKGGRAMSFHKLHFLLPSHRQLRWFWGSFFITLIFLGFITGFLYVACGKESGVQQPVLSVVLPSSSKSEYENSHPNDSDSYSISFLGWKKEFSVLEIQEISQEISRLYSRYGVLIPPSYRTFGGFIYLLYKLL